MKGESITDALRSLKNNNKLEPFIKYIRFPCYRNLEPNLKIDFSYPLTALVGQNGCNKSSILRAIYGCPENFNVGNFWFSTVVDPIDEKGGRPRFIYSYYQSEAKREVEVIKTRIQSTYKGGSKINPDYWEPSRPILGDGMEKLPDIAEGAELPLGREKTRWKLIKKNVLFMDFRSEISAFDKCFYHGDLKKILSRHSKQDFIRAKSKLLKRAVDASLQSNKLYKGQSEYLFKNVVLPTDEVKSVSKILGRSYNTIRIINHKYFGTQGCSVILQSNDLNYSEAFAGSGEFSVVMLVHNVIQADTCSLILLDEPEVSLHPGAQERLIDFLQERIKIDKHQIVVGTHSPFILKALPSDAVKTLFLDPATKKIKATSQTLPDEAFFHLEVEDKSKIRVAYPFSGSTFGKT